MALLGRRRVGNSDAAGGKKSFCIAQWYVVDGRTPQPAPKNAVVAREHNCALATAYGGPERRAGAWVRAGAAPDFRYPPYDINALAFSSPEHSIRWAVKVSRATAPGFGSYVGV